MFLDWGDGWKSVNDHAEDVAALAGFSIQWGTDDLAEQPEPSVMSFTLRDRTGWLTGRALTLAGARVLVQISEQPTWGMLRDDMGPWSAQHMRVEAMHQAYTPDLPSSRPARQSPCSTDWCRTAATRDRMATDGCWN